MIHSCNILDIDITKEKTKVKEKDFVLVDAHLCTIFVVEVKKTLGKGNSVEKICRANSTGQRKSGIVVWN